MRWIEEELAGEPLSLAQARTVTDIVRALVDDPPPRPQLLVADLEHLSGTEIVELSGLRDEGWYGSVIALGAVPEVLRTTLDIECVLARPFGSEVLRKMVHVVGLERATARIPKIDL
jgi:hypothetical protein